MGKYFFSELKEWSIRKHGIITKYTDGFCRITGNQNGTVYYIDGFAGQGIYDDGQKGSPVLLAEFSQSLRDEGKSYSLECMNVEKKTDCYKNLEVHTIKFKPHVINYLGEFNNHVDSIIRRIAKFPAIVFLDAFGISGMDWSSIRKLMHRNGITDFWIRFDHSTVLRLDGFYDSMDGSARAKLEQLKNFYCLTDIDKIHHRLQGQSSEDRMKNSVDLYLECLRNEFESTLRKQGYAAAYRIVSIQGTPKYYLAFASANSKGFILASDIVCKIEQTYQTDLKEYQEHKSPQLALFDTDPTQEEIFKNKVDNLKTEMVNKFCGVTIQRRELHTQLLATWFGKITSRHITQALKELHTEGKVLNSTMALSSDTTILTFGKV